MPNANIYPNSDEIEARERQFRASRMEEEAKIRAKYGDPEERKHEKERLAQEWQKMELDRQNGAPEREVWRNHLIRMYKMSQSIKDGDKSRRRAQHFAAAGLRTAAQMFADRASKLGKSLDSYTENPVVKELNDFNAFVNKDGRIPKEFWDKHYAEVKRGNPNYSDEQIRATVGKIWQEYGKK